MYILSASEALAKFYGQTYLENANQHSRMLDETLERISLLVKKNFDSNGMSVYNF
ncbi:hypothetical protein LEP1GSC188_1715 [Leptospira weilii serovar Topaz str. LT2116]|uniref:Uncharacterized protein n=1 Tax=Leptospira weilii serovar Topaz str. LT2116 TaxID=1088540 RepID=M3GZK9_9LEPT|nr:hypothetical protein LEP1GSC188_1715 [Leptospira weilii serovar Topaz str. LT2116]